MAVQRSPSKNPRKAGKSTKKVLRVPQRVHLRPSSTLRARSVASANGDIEGIRHLLSRYCFALDRGDMNELGPLFHREASFSVSFDGAQKHTGRETIRAWYDQFFQQRPGHYRHMRHKIYEPLVTLHGDTATAKTYFDSDSLGSDGKVHILAGQYDDTLVKESGQWLFKNRTISVFYHYSPGSGEEGLR